VPVEHTGVKAVLKGITDDARRGECRKAPAHVARCNNPKISAKPAARSAIVSHRYDCGQVVTMINKRAKHHRETMAAANGDYSTAI
jgi:hypothetical protein